MPSLSSRLTRRPRDPSGGTGVEALLAGTAAWSPHLADLLQREGDWLSAAIEDPEAALDATLAEAATAPPRLGSTLRRAKRRVALLVALMDLGGAWSLEEVTGALTRLADLAVDLSLRALVAEAIRRGQLPGFGEADAATAGGLFALAMGKMGAGELNYSSDIDLVLLFDEGRFDRTDIPQARAAFVKVARAMTALLQDRTAEGYVFRVDLRLRPDAATTPIVMAASTAESYYESLGRTWERAALIKARPAAGDLGAGGRFLQALGPFVWRKHLDFAAIQDAHDMRLRIRDHRGTRGPIEGPHNLDGHDVKLGRGGIREIEFFAQTRQLIAGGRDPTLRVRGTVEALAHLAGAGWVPRDVADRLASHYRRLREVEHRLQMVADAQTHVLPTSPEGWDRVAGLMDEDAGSLRRDLARRCEEVHELTEGFFAPPAAPTPEEEWGTEITSRWPGYPALRSPRAVEIFGRLRPALLRRLKEAARPPEALAAFDAFLGGLPAGVQLFSLFEANPGLLRLLLDVCAASPALARYLARNAGVLDAVIGGAFFAPWPGQDALEAELAALLARGPDYEAALNAARAWAKEHWFRVGVHHLQGLATAEEAGAQYADLAGAVVAQAFPLVAREFARRHGAGPGWQAVALGLGSLGARRLTASSDLDLIVIYEARGDASDGPRPLATRAYFARLTQALVTALSAPMAEGRLYEADMRLRPSGRQGPVATAWGSFRAYQREEAWTWEHLALTRARVVAAAGPGPLPDAVEAFRRDLVASRRGDPRVWPDLAAMRARLAEARPGSVWDAKSGPGRLRDLEILAQGLALLSGSPERGTEGQVAAGLAAGLLDEAEAETLLEASRLLWTLQAGTRLLMEGPFDPVAAGEGARRVLLRETGEASVEALAARLERATGRAAAVIDRVAGKLS